MLRARTIIGLLIGAVGLAAILFPFVSVWRLSGQALDQLPDASSEFTDSRKWLSSLGDPDFVVAERVYSQANYEEVEADLLAAGFERLDSTWLSKECCGEYDATWANVAPFGSDSVRITLTAADSDVQLSRTIFSVVGSLLLILGLSLLASGLGWTQKLSRRVERPAVRHDERSTELEFDHERRRGLRGF